MSKVKEFLKNPTIQVALATGICIIILAVFSRRILKEPFSYLENALPPFLMVIHSAVSIRSKSSKSGKTWIWIVAIFLSTALIIVFHLF